MSAPVRAAEQRVFGAASGRTLACAVGTAGGVWLDPDEVRILRACTAYAPVAVHAQRVAAGLGWSIERAAGVLDDLLARGLLEPIPEGPVVHDPAPLDAIVITTCGRPELLARALASHRATWAAQGRAPRVLVIDDTPDPGDRARSRSAAGDAEWLDRAGRRAWADDLARLSGVDAGFVARGLVGPDGAFGAGASRNAALLAHAGGAFLGLDDDTLARFSAVGPLTGHLDVGSVPDPTEMAFHDGPEEAVAAVPPVDVDALALASRLLGGTVAAVAETYGAAPRWREASSDLARAVRAGGRVRVAAFGLAGDLGMGSSRYLLQLQGVSRERLLADPRAFARRTARAAVRHVPVPTVTDSVYLGAGMTAFDHRALLPPFPPEGVGEDAVFAVVLRVLHPDVLIGHLPVVVPHLPTEVRRFADDDAWATAARIHPSTVLVWCVRSASLLPGASVPDRYDRLGRHLEEVARLPADDLLAFLHDTWCRHASGLLAQWHAQLEAYGRRPVWWAEALERAVDVVRAALPRPDAGVPGQGDVVARIEAIRRPVASYGSLLRAWPALVTAARGLR